MALRCGVLLSLAAVALGEPAAQYEHYRTSDWKDPDAKSQPHVQVSEGSG